jgi:hypothetical protein
MPWLLDPFCFLSACPRSVSVAVCSVLACCVLLVGAFVAAAAVPAGARVLADGQVHSCSPSLVAAVVPCCPALPGLLPPLRGLQGRSPPQVRRGPRFAFFFKRAAAFLCSAMHADLGCKSNLRDINRHVFK